MTDRFYLSTGKVVGKVDKDTKKIVKALRQQGFEVSVTRKGHLAVSREGRIVAVFSGTASDWRSMRNSLSDVKRAGFRWPPKR